MAKLEGDALIEYGFSKVVELLKNIEGHEYQTAVFLSQINAKLDDIRNSSMNTQIAVTELKQMLKKENGDAGRR